MKLNFLLGLLVLMITNTFSQQPPIEPGVPLALAQWRAKHYSDVRYKLNLTLEKGAPLMKGDIEIRVTLDEEGAKYPLVLDWRTTQVQNDKDKPFANVVGVNDALDTRSQLNSEHILIPNGLLKKGENIIKIQFASPIKTSGSAITRYIDKEDGSEYIYSLFVPSDASTAFPVFDQPDLKARFNLIVDAPKEWKVISNADTQPMIYTSPGFGEKSRLDKINGQEKDGRNLKREFYETKPISTYVFAFAAGDFSLFEDTQIQTTKTTQTVKSNEIQKLPDNPNELIEYLKNLFKEEPRNKSYIFVRKSQAEKFKPHAQEVFRLNRECVKYLEEYFDYKFPFPKYDLVLIPEFPFGGMEHAGATFFARIVHYFPAGAD